MSTKPLAEVYERLKELRRQGELPSQWSNGGSIQSEIGDQLDDMYNDTVRQSARFGDLIKKLGAPAGEISRQSGSFARVLEIRTLADRIFGDETKAEDWLNRNNPSFSGQRPIDLLKDELGAAVVREALEQIDHGIFA